MSDADKILKRFESLELQRSDWESAWQTCSDYVLPRTGRHNRKAQAIFDSTAPLALGRFAAALESLLTPRNYKWHSLVVGRADLDGNAEIGRWLEGLNDLLFNARYAPETGFANQLLEAYISLGLHGTAIVFVDDDPGRGLRYQCVPIHEAYLAEDAFGRVDTVFRWYRLTARQAAAEFGDKLPESILADAEDPSRMEKEYEFIHGVFPRKDFDRSRRDSLNLPVASVHLARAERKIVRESGYRSMPYAVSRFTVTAGDVYGRSPAMEVMPDIVQVNAMKKTLLRAAEKMVNPPLLTPEDDVLTAFSLKAGSINYGGLDDQGRQRVVPLSLGGNLPIGLEMIEQARKAINEGFYLNLFQCLVDGPQKTATEVVELSREKAELMAPAIGRQQSELLLTIVRRELDILITGGAFDCLPEMPPCLRENWPGQFLPKYETALARALDSREGRAIVQALSAIQPLANIDSSVMAMIDAAAAGRAVWKSFGAPAGVTRSREEMAAIKAAQTQAEGLALLAGQAQKLSEGAQNLSPEDRENVAGQLADIGQALGDGLAGDALNYKGDEL